MAAELINMQIVTITDVLQPNFLLQSEDTYLAGVVLVVKKCDRPLKVFKAVVNKYKLGVFEHPFFCKIEKNEGGTFGDNKKICEKNALA